MLYEIKVLKAPWPAGAKVGDVVDMPNLPVWAEGKCSVAPDGARATVAWAEGEGAGRALPPADEPMARRMAEAQGFLEDMRERHAAEIERMQADRDVDRQAAEDAITARSKAEAETDAQRRLVVDLKAKLADAEAALAAAKSAAPAPAEAKGGKATK